MNRAACAIVALMCACGATAYGQMAPTETWLADRLGILRLSITQPIVTGTIDVGQTPGVPIVDGRVDKEKITFKASRGDRTVTFVGTVKGDEIAFTRRVQVREGGTSGGRGLLGTEGPLTFTAIRIVIPQDRVFNSNGVPIRYVEQGQGEPVVLIHGLGGNLETWVYTGVMNSLAKDHRVIALDLRGAGKSGKPHDPQAYGAEMGLDITRLLDHLSIRRAHIVGYSLGASLTSLLLTLHPERFSSAVLISGAGPFEWTAEQALRAEQEAAERERECVSRRAIYQQTPPNAPKPSEEDIKRLSAECFASADIDPTALAAVIRGEANRVKDPARAAAVRVPTLGVKGSLEPQPSMERLKALRPDFKLVVVPGATHNSIVQTPELLRNIREFVGSN